jgi:hypothetical protein
MPRKADPAFVGKGTAAILPYGYADRRAIFDAGRLRQAETI